MKFRSILVLGLFLYLSVVFMFYVQNNLFVLDKDKKLPDKNLSLSLDLDSNGTIEKVNIKSYIGLPGEEKTEVYLNNELNPVFIFYGFLDNVLTHNIDRSGYKVLEFQLAGGHSINSLIYRYQNGELIRIPVSTEKLPYFMGIVARNIPEFIDLDNDGILEMLAYYRYFPPEKKRRVEVYKFNGTSFEKQKEYEEKTSEVYL